MMKTSQQNITEETLKQLAATNSILTFDLSTGNLQMAHLLIEEKNGATSF